jgi:fibro-slime domain-containing protein
MYVGGADGHPLYRGWAPVVRSAESFGQWFNDSTTSVRSVGFLELTPCIGAGCSPGQYRFSSEAHTIYGGFFPLDPMANNFPVRGLAGPTPAGPGTVRMVGTETLQCNLWPYWYSAATFGGPTCRGDQYLFPPSVDATTPGCMNQTPPCPNGAWVTAIQGWNHNNWFTSEARYLFVHTGQAFELQFFGDDDLFIYINGRLVLDLGGIHQRLPGRVQVAADGTATITEGGHYNNATGTIAACPGPDPNYIGTDMNEMMLRTTNSSCPGANANCDCRTRTVPLGLEMDRTYEIAIFHADRGATESNYQLTLSGFSTRRTVCTDMCGNMVVKGAEECDEGANNNDATYGGCTTECKFGPFCGDMKTDSTAGEECDLGTANNTARYTKQRGDGCTPGCKFPHYCGDAVIDRAEGEECDNADGNGMDNQCSVDCKLVVG